MILTRDGKEITAIYRQDGSEVEEVKDASGRLIYSASREITGTLPLSFFGRGKTLTDYLISGNTVQNGTPTPEAPVDVVGCGVMTKNVMPAGEQKTIESNGIIFSSDGKGKYTISGRATDLTSATFNLLSAFTTPISVSNGGKGTLSFFNTQSDKNVDFWFYNGKTNVDNLYMDPIERVNTTYNIIGNKYIDRVMIKVSSGATVDMTITPEFTNNGVLPASFEPYGYKLPLTINGTEYPIYLGQVPATRRIRKLVLTGEENWVITPSWKQATTSVFYYRTSDIIREVSTDTVFILSDRFKATTRDRIYSGNSDMIARTGIDAVTIRISDSIATTVTNLKAWLAQQYAAGTPVTVWYVLAEPETGIVNEPIHKIGDYADTISMAQAGVTIPTVSGANVLDTTSTVKPSEVYIKGKGIKPTVAQ